MKNSYVLATLCAFLVASTPSVACADSSSVTNGSPTEHQVNATSNNEQATDQNNVDQSTDAKREFVALHFDRAQDSDPFLYSAVAHATDKLGEIVTIQGKKYLRIQYFLHLMRDGYDKGMTDVSYSYVYTEKPDERISENPNIIEQGVITDKYQIAKLDIPIDGKSEVYLYGMSQTTQNPRRYERSALLKWDAAPQEVSSNNLKPLKILNIKQAKVHPVNSPLLPFDFKGNDGKWYSPYIAQSGKAFSNSSTSGLSETEINLERPSFLVQPLRKITYTLDNTEPTFNSPAAEVKNLNKDRYLPNAFYRIVFDPTHDAHIPAQGGKITIKIKGFNVDGTKSTDTQTLEIPFGAQTSDAIDTPAVIDSYSITASSNKLSAFNKGTKLQASAVQDAEQLAKINSLIAADGASKPCAFRLQVLTSDDKPADLAVADGWESVENPLITAHIAFGANVNKKNLAVYEYDGKNLKQISEKLNYSRNKISIPLQGSNSYLVIAEKPVKKQVSDAKTKLESTIQAATPYLQVSTFNGIELANIVEKAQEELSHESAYPSTYPYKYIFYGNRINDLITKIKNEDIQNQNLNHQQAEALINIVNQGIIKDIVTTDYYQKIKILADTLHVAIEKNNVQLIDSNLKQLTHLLNVPEFKYPTKELPAQILKYHMNTPSMASGVFNEVVQRVDAPDATYVVMNLKTLVMASIRGHLLQLDIFKDGAHVDKYPVYSLNKRVDINNDRKLDIFDSKIVAKLPKVITNAYDIAVKNDAMGTAPLATLSITLEPNYMNNRSPQVGHISPTPQPGEEPSVPSFDQATKRIAGETAEDTMQQIVQTAFPDPVDKVVLATSESYWDALSANSLAGSLNAPVLLTHHNQLPAQTIAELKRLKTSKVVVCGGENAISNDVVAQLKDLNIEVERIAGNMASDTANDIAKKLDKSDTAIVATSWGYEDALSAASFAYAKKAPIFLANYNTATLDASSIQTMKDKGVKKVYIVGGTSVVSPEVEAQLQEAGITVERIAGETAYDTSAKLATTLISLGMSANNMAIATGWGYTDALAGAALCGKQNSVMVLADSTNQTAINDVVAANKNAIQNYYIFGGTSVVGDGATDALKGVFTGKDAS